MTNQDISVSLKMRQQIGKGLNKLKAEGYIPAVIHNPGHDSIIVAGEYKALVKAYNTAGKRHPINLAINDKSYFTIIKDVDFDPKKNKLRHIVFGIIKQDEKIETEVALILTDDSPATKLGLVLNQTLDMVKIEAFPKDLPDSVTVDVSNLKEVGDKITIADIILPSGVTALTDAEHTVVVVEEKQDVAEEETPNEQDITQDTATESSES